MTTKNKKWLHSRWGLFDLSILFFAILFFAIFTLTSCASPRHQDESPQPIAQPKTQNEAQLSTPPPYNRKDWGQWRDDDRDCQNTRQEILIKESLLPVTFSRKTCTVHSGKWLDFYTGEILLRAADIEIDHVVPVKLVHELGGHSWDKALKRQFYNDQDNLVITSKKNNSQKSANDITVWQPANKTRACQQAQRWVRVKKKYQLKISAVETEYLALLTGCELNF